LELDETTRIYAGLSDLCEKVALFVRDEKKLPPFVVPASKQEREALEQEAMLKELARRYVGGF
jgi:hypothetical protein